MVVVGPELGDGMEASALGQKEQIEHGEDKPNSLSVNGASVPLALRERSQWVAWRYERRQDKQGAWKWTKVPINARSGQCAKSNNPETWTDFDSAMQHYRTNRLDGIGFMFSPGDDFVGIDLDDCLDLRTGKLQPWAAKIIADFDSYTEISPSGTGVKIFVRGKLPPGNNRRGPIEMYERGRYFAVTGAHLEGTPTTVNPRQEQLDRFHKRLFAPKKTQPQTYREADLSDQAILQMASEAANGSKFRSLWAGDTAGYTSRSEADLALCGLLAFWCQGDANRIDALFRQSGLMRDKWDQRRGEQSYAQKTIAKALHGRTEFYGGGGQRPSTNGHKPATGLEIILSHFREKYQPAFRRGTAVYSPILAREVKRAEACDAAGTYLLGKLAQAADAPRDRRGNIKLTALPGFFRNLARDAWVDLLETTQDENKAEEIHAPAEEDFRSKLTNALCTMVALGYRHHKEHSDLEVQRRPLFQWCQLFAKWSPQWQPIRGYQIWTKLNAEQQVCIAINIHLFGQVRYTGFEDMRQDAFADLVERYGLGVRCRAGRGGSRALELTRDFIDGLFSGPDAEAGDSKTASPESCHQQVLGAQGDG